MVTSFMSCGIRPSLQQWDKKGVEMRKKNINTTFQNLCENGVYAMGPTTAHRVKSFTEFFHIRFSVEYDDCRHMRYCVDCLVSNYRYPRISHLFFQWFGFVDYHLVILCFLWRGFPDRRAKRMFYAVLHGASVEGLLDLFT